VIQSLQDATFTQLTSIGHAFFTRKGGVSEDYYHSLNCSVVCSDKPEHVIENRQRAMAHLNLQRHALTTVKNVHGNEVIVVDNSAVDYQTIRADAMVTQDKTIVLASDSADCPIVLLADEQAEIIGLVHAGWRGAKLGVIENTIKKMIDLGAQPTNMSAVVSPCITQDSYEVAADYQQRFLADTSDNKQYFKLSHNPGHFMFDLLGFVKDKLQHLQLKSVTSMGLDTYANDDLFFSCRRATHQGAPYFGGQLSSIYFRP